MIYCANATCRKLIDRPAVDGWEEKIGYARPKAQRGQNSGDSLVERRPTGRFLCTGCIVEMQQGINKRQGALL